MKHTKGEWEIGLFPNLNHPHRTVLTESGKEICTIHLDNEEVRANVKLIAAAPNMLSALHITAKAFEELGIDKNQNCYKQVLLAIKKATQ